MSSLYRARVDQAAPPKVRLTVWQIHPDADVPPASITFALALISAPFRRAFVLQGTAPSARLPLAQAVDIAGGKDSDASWMVENARAFIASVSRKGLKNAPAKASIDWPPPHDRDLSSLPQAVLEIVATDPAWVSHLKPGLSWRAAAWDMGKAKPRSAPHPGGGVAAAAEKRPSARRQAVSQGKTSKAKRPKEEPMRQELVYQDRTSNKFWNVDVKGSVITTSWGRMGTKGSSKSERSSSPAAAEKKAATLVKGKLAKGYSRATGKPAKSSAAKKAPKRASGTAPKSGAKRKGAAPALPPSYVEWVRKQEAAPQLRRFPRSRKRFQVGPELERAVDPGVRRSKKLPGYPSRIVVYPPERLSKMQKLFVKALIPLGDLKNPVDHSHLLRFGHDTEHTSICWDPTATKGNGEMLICFIDGDEGDRRTDAGYDLARILRAYRPSDLDR